nr:MAG TPA_asm: hypothetical protein [Caudoviricetes sp.]
MLFCAVRKTLVFRILKREWWKHPAGLQKSLP